MSVTEPTHKRQLEQKLGYGQGSIYSVRTADSVAYFHIYSDSGRQREVRLQATSLSGARKECAARNTKKEEGRLVAPSTITFAQVAEEFLEMQRASWWRECEALARSSSTNSVTRPTWSRAWADGASNKLRPVTSVRCSPNCAASAAAEGL